MMKASTEYVTAQFACRSGVRPSRGEKVTDVHYQGD
jgi:hypothetical protein